MNSSDNVSEKNSAYNHQFLQITNSLFNAFRNKSHEELEETLKNWNDLYKSAMSDGRSFWAAKALTYFQDRLETAVMQHSHHGLYFSHRSITKSGVITPFLLNTFIQSHRAFEVDAEAMVMNMIANESYFTPGDPQKYIMDIGSVLHILTKSNDDHLAAKLLERIVPCIDSWYEFRNIVVKSIGYMDRNKDDSMYRTIISTNHEDILSYAPSQDEIMHDDAFNTAEILFLYRNGFKSIAEGCLNNIGRINKFSDLIEIDEYRETSFSADFIEAVAKRSPSSCLAYFFVSPVQVPSSYNFSGFEPINFVHALEQLTKSDLYVDKNKIIQVFKERFNTPADIQSLLDCATDRKIQDHPILIGIPNYNRARLNQDMSL